MPTDKSKYDFSPARAVACLEIDLDRLAEIRPHPSEAELGATGPWFRLAPEVLKRLSSDLTGVVIAETEGILIQVDQSAVLAAGAISGPILHRGRLCGESNEAALLFARQARPLSQVFSRPNEWLCWQHRAWREWHTKQDWESALLCLTKDLSQWRALDTRIDVRPVIWLALEIGQRDLAAASMKAVYDLACRKPTMQGWCDAARVYHHLFDDQAMVEKCLEWSRIDNQNAIEMLENAETHWDLLADEAHLRDCLESLEARDLHCSEWCALAETWYRCLADLSKTAACLEWARKCADSTTDWLALATFATELLADDKLASSALKRAQKAAQVVADHLEIAYCQVHLLADREAVQRLLPQAKKSENALLTCQVARLLGKELGDLEKSGETLELASSQAASSLDWCRIAASWLELLDNSERCRAALESAADTCQEAHAWMELAFYHFALLDDEQRAARNLEKAEKLCLALEEWTTLTSYWTSLGLDNTNKVQQLMEEAENSAQEAEEWFLLASTWYEIGSSDDSSRCLEEGVARTSLPRDHAVFAELVMQLFGDRQQAHESLLTSEELAEDTGDLLTTCSIWLNTLGDMESAQRCSHKAEAEALSVWDWLMLAESHYEIFDDEQKVRNALGRAESTLIARQEWELTEELANHWAQLLGDEDQAEACLERCRKSQVKARSQKRRTGRTRRR